MNRRGASQDPDFVISLTSHDLRREPFADAIEDDLFYFDSNRNQRLNLLLNLAPYSELILVTGEPGSGKTSLLRQFVLRAASRWTIARVVADATMSTDMLVRRICDEGGVTLNDAHESPLTLLSDHVRMLGRAGRSLILIIDDAQELSDEALAIIEQMLEVAASCGNPLSVMLSGAPRTRELLNAPAHKALARRCAHTLDVPALDEDGTAEYLRHRLTVCGHDPDSLSRAAVKKIYKASAGVPARINGFARAELAQRPAAPHGGNDRKPARSGTAHMYWLGIAVAAAAVALYWPDRVAEPPPPALEPIATAQEDPLDLPAPLRDEAPQTTEADEQILIEVPEDDAAIAIIGAADPRDAEPVSSDIEPPASGAGGEGTPDPTASMIVVGEPRPDSEAPTAASPDVDPAEAAGAAPTQVPKEIPPTTPDALPAAPRPAPSRTPETDASAAVKRETWLLQQPAQSFTLQLMSSDQEASVVNFIRQRGLGADVAYFRTLRNGSDWYAVVYSVYPTRDAALAAASRLRETLKDVQPWVRRMAAVHGDIQAAAAAHADAPSRPPVD